LLTEFVYAVVNAFEKLVPRFLCHQTQRCAFGNHVVEPMFGDFVEISVVGSDEIERIVSDVTRLMRV
jgi:putative ribosome biogenesis GTPase RsgA